MQVNSIAKQNVFRMAIKFKFISIECHTNLLAKRTDAAFRFYEEAEREGQRITQFITWFLLTDICVGAFCMAIGDALYNVFVLNNHNASNWYLPYKITYV